MSKSRDIADSAATINYIDTVTSNVQTQIDNLDPLPSQTGNSGKFLTTSGTVASWAEVSANLSVDFVASGALSSGQTVSLNSDGTVSAIGSGTPVTKSIPAAAAQVFNSNMYLSSIAFDPSSPNEFVIAFLSAGVLKAMAGSLSGTTATFGTAVTVGNGNDALFSASVAFNPNVAKQFVIVFLDANDSYKGKIRLGTVSSNEITLQSTVIYDATTTGVSDSNSSVAFDPNTSGKLAIVYKGSTGNGNVLVCSISGTTITVNSPVQFGGTACNQLSFSFDPNTANKLVITYQDGRNGDYGTSVIATISGTGVTFGNLFVFESAGIIEPSVEYNPATANHFAIAYKGSGQDGKSRLGTVSGTTISYPATAVTFATSNAQSTCISFDPNTTNKFVISYKEYITSYKVYIVEGTASSTTVSLGTPIEIFGSAATKPTTRFNPTASSAGQFMTTFADDDDPSDVGTLRLGQIASTAILGNTGFIGIADAAIADAATGPVIVQGGVSNKLTGLTANTDYYVQGNGAISATLSTVPAGQALSATELLISTSQLGVTATATELNYVSGVTSGIQTQIGGLQTQIDGVSGGLVFIQEVTASNVANITLSGFSSTYDSYQIEVVNVYGGNSSNLRMRFTVNGSELTSGYHSSVERRSAGSSSTNIYGLASYPYLQVTGDSLGAASSSAMSTTMRIFGYTGYKTFISHGLGNYGGLTNADAIGGHESSTGTLNSVNFFLNSGNIYGKFRLYGIVKS